MRVCGDPQRFGQMAFADRTFGQRLLDQVEVEPERSVVRCEHVVQLAAHGFYLRVRFGADVGQLRGVRFGQVDRVGEAFAAEVGAARVVRVVHPYAGGLVFFLQADELDVEQREQLALNTSVVPLFVAVHRIKVVDADHFHVFVDGAIQRVGQFIESAERVRRVQVCVDVDAFELMFF